MHRHFTPAIGLLAATLLSGCSWDRSFMQMDSNSGVPFFGLQWAVDSGSRPSKSGFADDADGRTPSLIDLRAPSEVRPPGRASRNLETDRDDMQTVSISRSAKASLYRRSKASTKTLLSTNSASSGNIPVHAITEKTQPSNGAIDVLNRLAAF